MKKVLTIISVTVLAATISCSQSNTSKNNKKAAGISFAETEHDFGKIEQGSEAKFAFVFKNTGKETLVISNVQTSCGCTIPEWTREPVKKNKSGVINVTYNTHVTGNFTKAIHVYSNATDSLVTLKIKGTVVAKSENPEKK